MAMPKHLIAMEFAISFNGLNYQENRIVLFNSTVISETEVTNLIKQGLIDNDPRVIVMTKQQYKNLYDLDKKAAADKVFYADLAMEQKETS